MAEQTKNKNRKMFWTKLKNAATSWRFKGFNDLKVIFKLYSSYFIILLILLIVSSVSLMGMNQMAKETQELYEKRLTAVSEMLTLSGKFQDVNAAMAALLLQSSEIAIQRIEGVVQQNDKIKAQLDQLASHMTELGIARNDFETFKIIWDNYMKNVQDVKGWIEKGNQKVGDTTGMGVAVGLFNQNMYPKIMTLNDQLANWVNLNKKMADEAYQNSLKLKTSLLTVQIVLILIAIALSILVGWAVARSLVKPLALVVDAAGEMSKGKLHQRVMLKRKDELGHLAESFNQMAENIRSLIREAKTAGDMVSGTSKELSLICEQTAQASNEVNKEIMKIAGGAETQMQTAEESARAMNEMARGVQHIAEASSEVTDLTHSTTVEAKGGNEAIQNAVRQIEAVKNTVEESAAAIKILGERSKEIGNIVEVITDIASQTNLLALNAAIEAARAGEHGRGFAVVASEVRKLSQRSEESAQQITGLIKEIQKETELAVGAMNKGTHEVQEGAAVVKKAGDAFERILHSVDNVFEKIESVSAIVEELSASTEEVAASSDESARIAKEAAANTQNAVAVTQEQLASIEAISDSANELNQMAQKLQEAIVKFEV